MSTRWSVRILLRILRPLGTNDVSTEEMPGMFGWRLHFIFSEVLVADAVHSLSDTVTDVALILSARFRTGHWLLRAGERTGSGVPLPHHGAADHVQGRGFAGDGLAGPGPRRVGRPRFPRTPRPPGSRSSVRPTSEWAQPGSVSDRT